MNERLDYLLSVDLDDELEPAEREELDRLLTDHPEAAARRARFESIDAFVKNIAEQPATGSTTGEAQSRLEAGLTSIQARIEEAGAEPVDELAQRRRRTPSWIPSIGLAAAAAMAVYFVVPNGPTIPPNGSDSAPASSSSQPLGDGPSTARSDFVDNPIALAVVFEVDEDSDTIAFIDTMSPDDFEIIEQLELLEFLAAREGEGRG
jgi:anti-sigma factor RsiW